MLANASDGSREWVFEDDLGSPGDRSAFSAQWRQVPMTAQKEVDHSLSLPDQANFLTTIGLATPTHSEFTSTSTSSVLSSGHIQTAAADLEGIDDYYAQSFSHHEDPRSSQFSQLPSHARSPTSPHLRDANEGKSALSMTGSHVRPALPFQLSSPLPLNDVHEIPSAAYLEEIAPQTVTVNLVVGIIALPSPRQVTVGRRWGRERQAQLVEMLVGDDTRAGFEITIWLRQERDSDGISFQRNGLELEMQKLRPQDIVLLQNIALCTYRGKVHGQSLRRDVTKIQLLYRRPSEDSEVEGAFSSRDLRDPAGQDVVRRKASRVKSWLMNFVGDDIVANKERPRAILPPDTQ